MNNNEKANASHAMDPKPTVLKATDTIECASEFIMTNRYRSLAVVDDNFCYMGMFGVNSLLKMVIPEAVFLPQGLRDLSFIHESFEDVYQRFALVKDKTVTLCMNNDIQPIEPNTPLTETLLQLYKTHASIPVVEPDSCKLLGMISYWDIGKKILAAGESPEKSADESNGDSNNA